MTKQSSAAVDRLKHELHLALDMVRTALDRIEILSAALGAFSEPVPDYEPGFRHLRHVTEHVIELS